MRASKIRSTVPNQASEVTPGWGTEDDSWRPRLKKAESFHRYTLGHELAAGGMATIYLARMRGPGGFDKTVVLKRMHSHLATRENSIQMFCDEALIQSRIVHPNVCPVLDFGQQDGQWFMALEYVEGVTLGCLLRRLSKTPDQLLTARWRSIAMYIAMQVAYGLHAAHELKDREGRNLGVVHRDVSPQNIMVGFDGSVRLLDFGVAKSGEQSHETATGVIMGKFAYMSPEQVCAKAVDRRSDIWALAVCLWEMLVARRLVRSQDVVGAIKDICNGSIPRPSLFRGELSEAVDMAVMGGLERSVKRRWSTAKEFGDRIHEASLSMPSVAGMSELATLVQDHCQADRNRNRELVEALYTQPGASDIEERYSLQDAGQTQTISLAQSALGARHPSFDPVGDSADIAAVEKPLGWFAGLRLAGGIAPLGLIALFFSLGLVGANASLSSEREPVVVVDPSVKPPSWPALDSRERLVAKRVPQGTTHRTIPPTPAPAPETEAEGGGSELESQSARDSMAEPSATRARQSQRRRARATGQLNVVTLGGTARVFRGNRFVGATPGQFRLPTGRHRLRIVPLNGGSSRIARVRVRSDRVARLSIRL